MKSAAVLVALGAAVALCVTLTVSSQGAGASPGTVAHRTLAKTADTSACPSGNGAVLGANLEVVDGLATGTFSIAAGCSGVEVSLASYQTSSASFSLPQTLFKSSTDTFDAGGPFSLSVDVPSCFFQVDLVLGGVIEHLTTDNVYGSRKLAPPVNGGSGICTTPPPVTTTVATTTTAPTTTLTTTTAPTTTTVAVAAAVAASPAVQTVDVSIAKVADPTTATVGDTVGYTLNVSNAGPATAADVVVAEDLPSGMTFISAVPSTGSCSGTGPVLCSLGNLAAGASASIHVEVRATTPGTIVNTATVSTSSPETNTANNKAQATVTVSAPATAPFTPPTVCSTLSGAPGRMLLSTRRIVFSVKVTRGGKPVAGARVRAKGPGVSVVQSTSAAGIARFSLRPQSVGTIEVTLLQGGGCKPQQLAFEVLAAVASKPPTFTG